MTTYCDPKTGKPIRPHDAVCQSVGILQAVYVARDSATDGEAMWGVFHMQSAAIEAAIGLLVGIMPDIENVPAFIPPNSERAKGGAE